MHKSEAPGCPGEWRSALALNIREPSLNYFLSPFWSLKFWSGSRISGKGLHLYTTSLPTVISSYIILLTALHVHWMQRNFMLTSAKCMKVIFKSPYFVVFYIHGSVHRHSILIRSNKMQQMQVFITANLLYMFRVSVAPIISSTPNCNCSFWYRSYHVSGQRPSASVALGHAGK